MNHLISSILFALSANLDNLTVGIAYGIKGIKINKTANLLIGIISAIGTFISMSIGIIISKFIPPYITNVLGALILVIIGIWFIVDFFKKRFTKETTSYQINFLEDPCRADRDKSGIIDIKEAFLLAFALTINNFGLGIGASITGLNVYISVIFTFIFSIITIYIGLKIGKSSLSSLFGKYSTLASGLIILVLGLYEILI